MSKVKKHKKVTVTGLSGVIGGILLDALPKEYEITDFYYRNKNNSSINVKRNVRADLLDTKNIKNLLSKSEPELVIHLAAITHIDVCEKDKTHGKSGVVWKTNVDSSAEIAKFCSKNRVPLIFMSTECVFNGKKESFSGNDTKDPINWYGTTKSIAEDKILSINSKSTVIRSVVAFHEEDSQRTIFGKLLSQIKAPGKSFVVSDQSFTPTYTYDIAKAIKRIASSSIYGVLHVTPEERITPHQLAVLIAKKYKFPTDQIKETTLRKMYGSARASLRLKNASLTSKKSTQLLKLTPKNASEIFKDVTTH